MVFPSGEENEKNTSSDVSSVLFCLLVVGWNLLTVAYHDKKAREHNISMEKRTLYRNVEARCFKML